MPADDAPPDPTATPERPGWQRLVAHDHQLVGTRLVRVVDGPGDGSRILEAWTPSGLQIEVLLDRGFDLFTARFRGVPLSWMGPPGLRPRTLYEPGGFGWLRTFHGGLLVTCGLDHFGGPTRRPTPEHAPPDQRLVDFGEHGRVSHEAAALVRCEVVLDGPDRGVHLVGVLTQSALYGEQLQLRRSIVLGIDEPTIRITDEVTNLGPLPAPVALLYHFNFGYPLVAPGSTVDTGGPNRHDHLVAEPTADAPETVDAWDLQRDERGRAMATLRNPTGLAVSLDYDPDTLPAFLLWALPRNRANVLGFAPATGRTPEQGPVLETGRSRRYDLRLTVDLDEGLPDGDA